jgi:predicted PurR-regulated permease PerM
MLGSWNNVTGFNRLLSPAPQMMPSNDFNQVTAATQEPQGTQTTAEETPSQRLEIHIPLSTFLKVFAALLSGYAIYKLWPLLLLVFLALFLAVTLHAFVEWLDDKGLKHCLSLLVVIGGLLGMLGLGMALVFPALIAQATAFSQNLPKLREDVLLMLPEGGGIRQSIEHIMESAHWSEATTWLGHFLTAGGFALGGISEMAMVLVISLYLLIDGKKTYEWFLAFFSPLKRAKLRLTSNEISTVIFGYVAGQVVTSALVVIFAFTVLSLLHVPGALMMSILAGVLDILPVFGFIVSTVPAFLLALSVSPRTAVIVLSLYLLFHALENYLIIPKVYGKNLRVSTLTVLLGLLAGTLLAGIPGAIAALPIIASYAAVERIWLKPFLRDGVSEKHELQKDQVFGDKA